MGRLTWAFNERMSDEGNAPRQPIIRGEKVWLRGFLEEDLDPYLRFVTSQEAWWAGYSLPTSHDAVKGSFRSRFIESHGKDGDYFVVSPLGSTEFIGTTWLWNKDSRLGGLELSVFMHDPARWGTGLGTDAINATLDYAFGSTDVEKIWLATLSVNERAQRSFEKAGFRRDGAVRSYTRSRGDVQDAVLMSILRDEWGALTRRRSWDFD